MKILVICQYYYPENFQITPICEDLVSRGHDVTVLTGLPNYGTGEIPKEYRKGHRKEIVNGVNVIRCNEIARRTGPINLALNYLSFLLSSMHKVNSLDKDFDIVFCYQLSPVLMGLSARKYATKFKKPFLLYCCDLWPESLKMYLKSENSLFFKVMKNVSKKVYSSANIICCQSKSFIDYLGSVHEIPRNKMIYVPAFADEFYLNENFDNDNGIIDFVFLGNLGIAQNLFKVMEAIKINKDLANFKFHFIGDGVCLKDLQEYVVKNDLTNLVEFYGRRPVEQMPDFYKLADVCVVSLKADNATGLTLPSKVQGYMAAGKTILGMIDGSAAEVIKESQCGICVNSDDVQAFAEAMRNMVEHKENYKDCGNRGRQYFLNNFRKKICLDSIEKELIQCKENRNV